MCLSLSFSARWWVFACMVSDGQKAAKAAKAKNDRMAVQLPDAYSRVPYNNKITDALGSLLSTLKLGTN